MKRIPRQVPAPRSTRQYGAESANDPADSPPDACIAARARMAPRAAALLDRMRHERDLRLERGLVSEASGIDLAMHLLCEATQPPANEALSADLD
jgi:hypothetical protein